MAGNLGSYLGGFSKHLAAIQAKRIAQNVSKYSGEFRVLGDVQKKWTMEVQPKSVPHAGRVRTGFPSEVLLRNIVDPALDYSVDLIGDGCNLGFGKELIENHVSVFAKMAGGIESNTSGAHNSSRTNELDLDLTRARSLRMKNR
jgi:hypothetical protein